MYKFKLPLLCVIFAACFIVECKPGQPTDPLPVTNTGGNTGTVASGGRIWFVFYRRHLFVAQRYFYAHNTLA